MLEVEVRYRYADRAALVAKLSTLGAQLAQSRTDVDRYFNPPDRDLKAFDEAFRLRRVGLTNYLTYKGPKRDTETKTRTEIEIPLASGDETAADAERLLLALRYRPIATVRKERQVYRFARGAFQMEACFDDIAAVGSFIELEIMADENDYEAAKSELLRTAAELGLTEKETRSYLGLVLARSHPRNGRCDSRFRFVSTSRGKDHRLRADDGSTSRRACRTRSLRSSRLRSRRGLHLR
jgi:adenylate cyclase class 2